MLIVFWNNFSLSGIFEMQADFLIPMMPFRLFTPEKRLVLDRLVEVS